MRKSRLLTWAALYWGHTWRRRRAQVHTFSSLGSNLHQARQVKRKLVRMPPTTSRPQPQYSGKRRRTNLTSR